MKKTFFHKGIACLMAFTLFLTPGIPALAEESQTTEPIEPTEEATTPQEEMSLSDMAKSKASVLTSMYKVDSIQYALIDNDSIVLSGEAGYADKASKRMPYQSTIYGVGSISKVFTTVAVMQLVEQGKVNLDYPVTTYIDDFKMADARYRDITVGMLLNHSSGLLGSTLINSQFYGDNDHSTYDNFLELLSTQRLKADPGAFSVYCNDGFTLAELLVERVSGKTFTEYLEEYISKPMSLHDTKTPMDNINDSQMAGIYNPGSLSALPYETLMMIGAGGIYSTAADLCRFSRAFFTDNNTLLTNSSKKAMGEKEYLKGRWMDDKDSYSGYGLGWDTVNTYPFSENNMKVLAKGGDLS